MLREKPPSSHRESMVAILAKRPRATLERQRKPIPLLNTQHPHSFQFFLVAAAAAADGGGEKARVFCRASDVAHCSRSS